MDKESELMGISPAYIKKLIGAEFGIVDDRVIARHYKNMILAKFIHGDTTGIKANKTIEEQFKKYKGVAR